MEDIATQKDRIVEFLNQRKISKNKFYIQTGVANGTLDKKSGITGDTISKIYKTYPEINLEWLIAGEGEMLKKDIFKLYNNLNAKGMQREYAITNASRVSDMNFSRLESPLEFIPIFSYEELNKCEGYLSIPNLNTCDGAGYVKTDSMYPIIKPGDIVCYKTANNTSNIYWGEIYILHISLDGEEFITIKNIEKSDLGEDYVRLTGYNKMYYPKDVLLSSIKWKAAIKASINYNSIM